MRPDVFTVLRCAVCGGLLRHEVLPTTADTVAVCVDCRAWYPVEDEVLELLPPALHYPADRSAFWSRHAAALTALGLAGPAPAADMPGAEPQRVQQSHFDWYAANDVQTYAAYERTPFWQAEDELAFAAWRREIRPGSRVLDVGCAQGRSAAHLRDLDIDIVGFDVSKPLVRLARARARAEGWRARTTFFAGDASRFPVTDSAFDYVLVYGVLHHLPDPAAACLEIARVLKPGGVYFGSENNRTVFRALFDTLQRWFPLWHEEAGAQPLVSRAELAAWLGAAGLKVETRTSVFVPPHLCNGIGATMARRTLAATDAICGALPGLRNQGGLILIRAQ